MNSGFEVCGGFKDAGTLGARFDCTTRAVFAIGSFHKEDECLPLVAHDADMVTGQQWHGPADRATTRMDEQRQSRPEDSPTFKGR